jgi:hypothetical protein
MAGPQNEVFGIIDPIELTEHLVFEAHVVVGISIHLKISSMVGSTVAVAESAGMQTS